jgi:hypothetical protein
MKKTAVLVLFLAVLMNSNTSFAEDSVYDEVEMLWDVFQTEVSDMAIGDENYEIAALAHSWDILAQSPYAGDKQYFVFADRNPDRQNVMVAFYNPDDMIVSVLGWARTSTGDPSRAKHWETPTGIFENSVENPGWRAQGTKNAKGWRGYGARNSKVWNFGRQRASRNGKRTINIHLMMHATDPIWGEKRLGRRDSAGCVRIPAKMNRFLDTYGLIDGDYFNHPNSVASKLVLLPESERKTVHFPGRYLIVGDFPLSE